MTGESIALIEPLLPESGTRKLEDLAVSVVAAAESLKASLNPLVSRSLGRLVRSMNCYYSNLIEGHRTLPVEIERALNNNFSDDPRQKSLQQEAKAHIAVQELIDNNLDPSPVVSQAYLRWLHRSFCSQLPSELLIITSSDGQRQRTVIGGEYRTGDVIVGSHIPISSQAIPKFLTRFEQAYNPERLSLVRQVIAVAASHHRLLWIHPFYDGNGRVARLFSHAFLKQIGLGNSLWSISRGLSRNVKEYKSLLACADRQRWNALDGRGNLTAKGLNQFCEFFLSTCLDQIQFMSSLLEPHNILMRIELYVAEEVKRKNLLPGSDLLLKQAWWEGELARGRASQITGYGERQARSVLKRLIEAGLLVSDSPKGPVRLSFPLSLVERFFPALY